MAGQRLQNIPCSSVINPFDWPWLSCCTAPTAVTTEQEEVPLDAMQAPLTPDGAARVIQRLWLRHVKREKIRQQFLVVMIVPKPLRVFEFKELAGLSCL